MNKERRSRRTSQRGLTLLEFVIFLGIVLVLALGVIFAFLTALRARVGAPPATISGIAYVGTYKIPPPLTLTGSTQVTYKVVKREFQINGGGPPGIFGTPTPFAGATLTFTLDTSDATVNGGPSVTVITDANGEATVTLAPLRDGGATLRLDIKVANGGDSEDPFPFEVDAP